MTLPDPWGAQFQMGIAHSSSKLPQVNVAVLRDGWIAVTWLDGVDKSIKGQILNADGTAFGSVFDISGPGENTLNPNIVALPNGRFVVAYDSMIGNDDGWTLNAKTFDVFQGQIDNPTVIHVEDTSIQPHASIVSFADGSYIFTYTDGDSQLNGVVSKVRQTVISDTGSSTSEIFDQDSTGNFGKSIVLATQDPRYVSVYQNLKDGSRNFYFDIRDENGERVALKSFGGLPPSADDIRVDIAALDNGNFVFAWVENSGSSGVLKAAIYSADGIFLGSSTLYAGNQPLSKPAVQRIDGGFVFAAAEQTSGAIHLGTSTGSGIERFDLTASGPSERPNISALNDGRFLVQWVEANSDRPIKAQIYDPRKSAVDWTASDTGVQYGGTKFGDQLHGADGKDTLFGAGGNDGMTGGAGSDSLVGGIGADTLDGGSGADTLDGGADWDMVSYLTTPGNQGVVINLTTGDAGGAATGDVLRNIEAAEGSNADDTITGLVLNGQGTELRGAAGNDRLIGQAGADTLKGGSDNDTLTGGGGGDTLDGGDGIDRASYINSGVGVTINLKTGKGTGGDAAGDTLVNIEELEGSNHADTLTGSDGAGNWISAHDGDDLVTGGSGLDVLGGDAGNDILSGGSARDILYGGIGNDTLIGGSGADHLDGEGGIDRVSYINSGLGVTVNLRTGTGMGGDAEGDTLVNIEELEGSNHVDTLTGSDGAGNWISAHDGDDLVTGGSGLDVLGGDAGNDILSGGSARDILYGGIGNDTLIGGSGADHLDGEGGIDRVSYLASDGGVTVDLRTGTGTGGDAEGDTLVNVEALEGSNLADTLTGSDGAGNWISAHDGDDLVTGGSGLDVLGGDAGNDILSGGSARDILYGGIGNDTLIGGSGADHLDGESGTDRVSYLASDGGVTVDLRTGTGTGGDAEGDTLVNIEELEGSNHADTLTGKDGAGNWISAHDGDDLVTGGSDLDVLGGDAGNDTLDGGSARDILYGGAGHDLLVGGMDDDHLDGEDGNDTLNGGSGADTMVGKAGDDTYYIDSAGDIVIEDKDGGTDTAIVSLDFTMDAVTYIEVLKLADGTQATRLDGGASNDRLIGNTNFNIIDGGAGADTMEGGAGSDVFIVDNAGDKVVEAAGGGTDAIQTTISYALNAGMEIEVVTALGPGAVDLTGNELNNTLNGNAAGNQLQGLGGDDALNGWDGNDVLDGGAGADRLQGDAGDDVYRVDQAGDQVIETAGGGIDTVQTSVSYALAADAEVEFLTAAGSASVGMTGNAFANTITGGNGADTLKGLAGDDAVRGGGGGDRLFGGLGRDILTGDVGKDVFVFDSAVAKKKNANVDKITAYSVKDDAVWLDNAAFKKLGSKGSINKPAKLKAGAFWKGAAAHDSDDRILYDKGKGILYYDPDGTGHAAKIKIATLPRKLKMTEKEFFII